MASEAASGTSLLDLSEPKLLEIARRLDSPSRIALCRTCKRLNCPAVNSFFTQLTLDWAAHPLPGGLAERGARPGPPIHWPKAAPAIKSLHLVAGTRHGGGALLADADMQLTRFLGSEGPDMQVLQSVTSLHLQGWVVRHSSAAAVRLLELLKVRFPLLTRLELDRCAAFDMVLSKASMHLEHLTHLIVQNGQPDFVLVRPPNLLLPGLGGLKTLASLTLATPHTYERFVDVSPLSALAQLEELELALPALRLEGLREVSQGCTQLRKLIYVDGETVDPNVVPQQPAQTVCWPSLVEAHLVVTGHLLLQLGLHNSESAPKLRRLHFQAICPAGQGGQQTREDFTAIAHAFSQSAALQPPLVVSCVYDLPRILALLAPMSEALGHLVLCHTQLRAASLGQRMLSALRALPRLTCLTLGSVDPDPAAVLGVLLAAQQQLQRVIIGIGKVHMGYNHWAPSTGEAQLWYDTLSKLVENSAGSHKDDNGDASDEETGSQSQQSKVADPAAAQAAANASTGRDGAETSTISADVTASIARAAAGAAADCAASAGAPALSSYQAAAGAAAATAGSIAAAVAAAADPHIAAAAAAGMVARTAAAKPAVQSTKPPAISAEGPRSSTSTEAGGSPRASVAPATTTPATAEKPSIAATTEAEPPKAVHIYFGVWCPAARIDFAATNRTESYTRLRELAAHTSSASRGPFILHECDNCSAADMALGPDRPWLQPLFNQLKCLWEHHGPQRWEEAGVELSEEDYNCCSNDLIYGQATQVQRGPQPGYGARH